MDLEEVWRIREEEIYPELFGSASEGIYPLSQELFSSRFGQDDIDPRWPFSGVFVFPPSQARAFWLYVTSGHSNPWDEEPEAYSPEGPSGTGIEFMLAAAERGDWAIRTLQNMLAFDLLLRAGRFPGRGSIQPGNRIPLRSPIDGDETCLIRNLVAADAVDLPAGFVLPSGRVQFVVFAGATDAEIAHAKEHGSDDLLRMLHDNGFHPVIDPRRASLV